MGAVVDTRPQTLSPCPCAACEERRGSIIAPPYTATPEIAAWRKQADPLMDALDMRGLLKYWSYHHVISAALGHPMSLHLATPDELAVALAYLRDLEATP